MNANRATYRPEWAALLIGGIMVFGSAAMHCRSGDGVFLAFVALGGFISLQAVDLLTMRWDLA